MLREAVSVGIKYFAKNISRDFPMASSTKRKISTLTGNRKQLTPNVIDSANCKKTLKYKMDHENYA